MVILSHVVTKTVEPSITNDDYLVFYLMQGDIGSLKFFNKNIDKEITIESSFIYVAQENIYIDHLIGDWKKYVYTIKDIVKLLVSVDYSQGKPIYTTQVNNIKLNDLFYTVSLTNNDPKFTLIAEILKSNRSSLFPLFENIRNTERYWIIIHLLKYLYEENESIKFIGDKYGLSGTHFRRLCHRYLGERCKFQLRKWRGIIAVIHILSNSQSLTRIAVDNGFCSASHFSNEIKSLFGISPREFRKLSQNLYL